MLRSLGVLVLAAGGLCAACGDDAAEAGPLFGCEPPRLVVELAALDDAPAAQTDLFDRVMHGCDDSAAVLAETYRLGRQAAAEEACPVAPPPTGSALDPDTLAAR